MKEIIAGVVGSLIGVWLIFQGIYGLTKIRWQTSNKVVSGIAYNVESDKWISGATTFSIRASEDTFVSEENKSSFCLPKGSEYIDLVKRAAEDKTIKLIVTSEKINFHFAEGATTCVDNVKVVQQ